MNGTGLGFGAAGVSWAGEWDGDVGGEAARSGGEDEDAVGEDDGFVDAVCDEEDGCALPGPDGEEFGLEVGAGLGVEGAEGFVHQEGFWACGEGAGDADALAHAAGEFVGVARGEGFEAGEGEHFAGRGCGGLAAGVLRALRLNSTLRWTVIQGKRP